MNKSMGIRAFVVGIALAAGVTSAREARADATLCTPTRVRTYVDRIDMRCQGIDAWFVALRSNTSEALVREMLMLVNAAIVAGKPLQLYYTTTAGQPSRALTGVEMFP